MTDAPELKPCLKDETTEWVFWKDKRTPNTAGKFRFRAKAQILGMELMPEWTTEQHCCGMGYQENQWWPKGVHHWDGYRRYITIDTLEWRDLNEGEDNKDVIWHGLDLKPCPHTGKPPKIDYCPYYVGAPPYKPEWLIIESGFMKSHSWQNALALQKAWNTRTPDPSAEKLAKWVKSLLGGIDTRLVKIESEADETLANTLHGLRAALKEYRGTR